jgi:hypothetical protein
MKKSKSIRVIAIAGLALVTVVTTTLVTLSSQKHEPKSTKAPVSYVSVGNTLNVASPAVGDCWRSQNFADDYASPYYVSGTKVACANQHDSVTFFVESLPASTHFYYEPGTSFGHTPSTSDALEMVQSKCSAAYKSQFSDNKTRLTWMWFIPDPFSWAAGARWLRCDVFAAKWGSHVGAEVGALVNSDLTEIENHYLDNDYQICVRTGNSGHPEGSDATYVDCNGVWDLRLLAQLDLTGELGDSYPGTDAIQQSSYNFCNTLDVDTTYYYPTESGWADGNTSVKCWEPYY